MAPAIVAQRAFLRATVTNFFFFTSLNGFVLLPLHIARLGGTEVEIGLVMAAYSALGIVCQPLVGFWVDVLGRRPFLLVGVALLVLSAVVAALSGGIPGLAVARALQGIAFSVFFVANFSHVLDLVPPGHRGRALGLYGMSGLLSSALAPLIGEWVVRAAGFRPLFVGCAAVAGVAGALAWGTAEQRRDLAQPVRGAEWVRTGVEDLLRLPMAVTVFFGLGTGVIFAFLPTFAEGLGVRVLSLFYTAYAGAAMGVRLLGGRLIDTEGRRAVIVPSLFGQALAVAFLGGLGLHAGAGSPAVPALPVLVLVGLLAGGAHGFLYPGLAALVTDEAPAERRGAVVGVFSAVFLAGHAGGAFAFGWVAHAAGYGAMWAALAGLLLAGALLSLRLPGGGPFPRKRAGRGLY